MRSSIYLPYVTPNKVLLRDVQWFYCGCTFGLCLFGEAKTGKVTGNCLNVMFLLIEQLYKSNINIHSLAFFMKMYLLGAKYLSLTKNFVFLKTK